MTDPITTFSGAHPYRPQCVVTAAREVFEKVFEKSLHVAIPELAVKVAEVITTDVSKGRCPRCHDPLYPDVKPGNWKPAGTRALPCRCLPVCETCASWIEPIIGTNPVTAWPTDTDLDDDGEETRKEHEHERVMRLKAQAETAVLEAGPGGLVLVTTEGVAPVVVQPRPHPGGWLEFGYDDTDDQRERTS
jgi:hypothetical protein